MRVTFFLYQHSTAEKIAPASKKKPETPHEEHPELATYITDMRHQGYHDEQIKQALLDQGWQDKDIGHFFN